MLQDVIGIMRYGTDYGKTEEFNIESEKALSFFENELDVDNWMVSDLDERHRITGYFNPDYFRKIDRARENNPKYNLTLQNLGNEVKVFAKAFYEEADFEDELPYADLGEIARPTVETLSDPLQVVIEGKVDADWEEMKREMRRY